MNFVTNFKVRKSMSRGGKRMGVGRKKNSDSSITIRVPVLMKQTIKEWIKTGSPMSQRNQEVKEKLVDSIGLLENALQLKANAGGKIKTEIRRAIELLLEIKT